MKPISWVMIIITILVVAVVTIKIDAWATEWKDLFFYLDKWELWIAVVVAVWVVKKIIDWTWRAEVRLLK